MVGGRTSGSQPGTYMLLSRQHLIGPGCLLFGCRLPGCRRGSIYNGVARCAVPAGISEAVISPVGSSAPLSQALIVVRIPSAGVELASSRASRQPLGLEDIVQISAGRNHSFARAFFCGDGKGHAVKALKPDPGASRHWGVVCLGSDAHAAQFLLTAMVL